MPMLAPSVMGLMQCAIVSRREATSSTREQSRLAPHLLPYRCAKVACTLPASFEAVALRFACCSLRR